MKRKAGNRFSRATGAEHAVAEIMLGQVDAFMMRFTGIAPSAGQARDPSNGGKRRDERVASLGEVTARPRRRSPDSSELRHRARRLRGTKVLALGERGRY